MSSLSHLQWRAPEFLLAVGGQLANPQLAMEYFSLSPFFDKASNNAQLRMQMMFSRGGMEGVDEEAELRCVFRRCYRLQQTRADELGNRPLPCRRFTGIEYVVAHASPPDLFILHKRNRSSPHEATVLGAFYILNGNVYQAPSLFEVLNERIVRSFLSFFVLSPSSPRPPPPCTFRFPCPSLHISY
jgi:mediator of RNA polymerase II transcription subunit 6